MILIKRSCVILFAGVFCFGFISNDSAYQLVEEGNTFYANGNYQDARSMYERAEGIQSNSAGIQYNLGNVYFKQFDLARATESYKRVLLMGDTRLQSLAAYNLGNIRYQQTLNALSVFRDSMRS